MERTICATTVCFYEAERTNIMKTLCIIVMTMLIQVRGDGRMECGDMLDSGDVYYAAFDNRTALDWYTHAYAECPDSYEALMKMGRASIDAGEETNDASFAENMFLQGIYLSDSLQNRFPDSSQAYFLKSVAAGNLCLIRTGVRKVRLAKMVEHNAIKAVELGPDFAPAYVVLGIYYREIAIANPINKLLARIVFGGLPGGTLEDSEQTFHKALALSPENCLALLELARTNLLMEKKSEAIKNLKKLQLSKPAWHLDAKIKREGERLLQTLTR